MGAALPEPLDAYFLSSNAHDPDRVADCFAEDGRIHDEASDHKGHDAIRSWAVETARKYQHRQDVLALEQVGDRYVVTVRVTGTFPGSPIELRNRFQIRDRKIADLEIG